ncbi:unnamed protein product, partial [Ceratitis capitata]
MPAKKFILKRLNVFYAKEISVVSKSTDSTATTITDSPTKRSTTVASASTTTQYSPIKLSASSISSTTPNNNTTNQPGPPGKKEQLSKTKPMAELEIFCAKWSTDLASDQTETLLNVKLQQLDKNWDSLLEAYEAIFMADAYPEVSESVEQKYAKYSESFQNCKAQMLEALQLFTASVPTQTTHQTQNTTTYQSSNETFLK